MRWVLSQSAPTSVKLSNQRPWHLALARISLRDKGFLLRTRGGSWPGEERGIVSNRWWPTRCLWHKTARESCKGMCRLPGQNIIEWYSTTLGNTIDTYESYITNSYYSAILDYSSIHHSILIFAPQLHINTLLRTLDRINQALSWIPTSYKSWQNAFLEYSNQDHISP